MPCEFTGVRAYPLWKRNRMFFDRHNPPPYHSLNSSGLIISDVNLSMNMSSYSCYLDLFAGARESTVGFITVITHAGNNNHS